MYLKQCRVPVVDMALRPFIRWHPWCSVDSALAAPGGGCSSEPPLTASRLSPFPLLAGLVNHLASRRPACPGSASVVVDRREAKGAPPETGGLGLFPS